MVIILCPYLRGEATVVKEFQPVKRVIVTSKVTLYGKNETKGVKWMDSTIIVNHKNFTTNKKRNRQLINKIMMNPYLNRKYFLQ